MVEFPLQRAMASLWKMCWAGLVAPVLCSLACPKKQMVPIVSLERPPNECLGKRGDTLRTLLAYEPAYDLVDPTGILTTGIRTTGLRTTGTASGAHEGAARVPKGAGVCRGCVLSP